MDHAPLLPRIDAGNGTCHHAAATEGTGAVIDLLCAALPGSTVTMVWWQGPVGSGSHLGLAGHTPDVAAAARACCSSRAPACVKVDGGGLVMAVPVLSPVDDEAVGAIAVTTTRSATTAEPATVELAARAVAHIVHGDAMARAAAAARAQAEDTRMAHVHTQEMARREAAYLADMSHELRTPLTSIIAYADILSTPESYNLALPAEAVAQYATTIHGAARHMADLVNDILDNAKLKAGQESLYLDDVDVCVVVRELVNMVRPNATRKMQTIEVRVPSGGLVLQADRVKLKSIIYNLLTNAIKYTDADGQVWVTVSRGERDVPYAVIAVEDTGRGIPPDQHLSVFDEYVQAHNRDRAEVGTGLGLSLARRWAELHRGHISLMSSLGVGSVFTVEIPIRQTDAPAPPAPPRVLLVEDDPGNGGVASRLLELAGALVVWKTTAEAGLAAARSAPFDVILTDLRLGAGPTGLDILRAVRADPATNALPVIIVSAATDFSEEDAMAAGCSAFIAKPLVGASFARQVLDHIPPRAERRLTPCVHLLGVASPTAASRLAS